MQVMGGEAAMSPAQVSVSGSQTQDLFVYLYYLFI